jgi:hypothetical protein
VEDDVEDDVEDVVDDAPEDVPPVEPAMEEPPADEVPPDVPLPLSTVDVPALPDEEPPWALLPCPELLTVPDEDEEDDEPPVDDEELLEELELGLGQPAARTARGRHAASRWR